MKTFAQDHTLSALPVPELRATCDAVPELVAPLVDAPTLERTMAALEEFTRPGGAGELLQGALRDRQGTLPGNASWLRPFWDDMYMSWRGPLPLDMNYCFRFDERRWGDDAALARLTHGLGKTLLALGREELEPEQARTSFLSMDQARSCLYTRIPGHNQDSLLPVEASGPRSIAVSCRGCWFVLPLLYDDDQVASVDALNAAFAAIRREAAEFPPCAPVAAMTSASREDAAATRALVCENLQNRISLATLEQALFVVCLEPPHASDEDMLLYLLAGDASSRWFDKSLQVIATENNGLGANFEHCGCDAAIWMYLLDLVDKDIVADLEAEAGQAPEAAKPANPGLPAYRMLRWDVSTPLAARLEELRQAFFDRVKGLDLLCREFLAFSRETLKSLGTSPDAFLQIAFQTAQHQVFGRLRSSYEAISVRNFAQGRTECARSSTGDALAFALAQQKGTPPEKLLDLYRQAERAHKARMLRCQRGLGVERHMYGLKVMYTLYGKALGLEREPAIFSDPGWLTLKHDALSTSGIGAPFIRFFGFAPVVEDGFGIGYAPGPDVTGLAVTSWKKNQAASGFVSAFEQAAASLAALLIDALPPASE